MRHRAKSLARGVSLRGDASFVSVPVTGAPRRHHASRLIGRRGRTRDGKIPLPESTGMLSHMTDAAQSHVKMRQIAGNQLHHLKCSSLQTVWPFPPHAPCTQIAKLRHKVIAERILSAVPFSGHHSELFEFVGTYFKV